VGQIFQEEDTLRTIGLSLGCEGMRKVFLRGILLLLLLGGLVSCAGTGETSDSGGGTSKSSVPGADDPDRAGALSPAAGANGAGASVRF
jgi:hypothetical protein